jgi:hypothetical protein
VLVEVESKLSSIFELEQVVVKGLLGHADHFGCFF